MIQRTHTKWAIKWCKPTNLFCFRNWYGQETYYTEREVMEFTLSDESRQMMDRLCFAAIDRPNEWLDYGE